MANIFFLSKKKAFRFFNILFISYNNFIINYKTVHTLAQLTNILASTNTKQSTHNKVFLHVVQNQHNSQILQQAQIQKSLHVRNPVQMAESSGSWTWLCHLLRTWIRHPRDVIAALCNGNMCPGSGNRFTKVIVNRKSKITL